MTEDPACSRLRVLIVAEGSPSVSGLATLAETIVRDAALNERFEVDYLNTARAAVRVGGNLSFANVRAAVVDVAHTYTRARRAGVVHLHTASDPIWSLLRTVALGLAARAGRAGLVIHVHSFLINAGAQAQLPTDRRTRLLFRCLSMASTVVSVSEPGRELLGALVPGTTIEACSNAVDVASFEAAEPGLGEPTIVYVGTLLRRKGVIDLVSALARLRERVVGPWGVRIVGGGAQAGEHELELVRRAVGDAGFADALTGPLGGDALRAVLRNAAIYVLPSYLEGQPVAILEAMATGLPIVATPVGAVPDMVRDGDEGLLVPPGDPEGLAEVLTTLLGDTELRIRMGSAARRRAEERFDLPELRERLDRLYRRADASRRRG